jgi:hypothetical protein
MVATTTRPATGREDRPEEDEMARCVLCDYPRDAASGEQRTTLCSLCAVRTTPEERLRYIGGRRIASGYMDSD